MVERVAGTWTPASSGRLLERVENVACAIRDAGLVAGDRVALIAHNCVDWVVADFATFFAGCVVVPIYPTQALDHTAYILEHSGRGSSSSTRMRPRSEFESRVRHRRASSRSSRVVPAESLPLKRTVLRFAPSIRSFPAPTKPHSSQTTWPS